MASLVVGLFTLPRVWVILINAPIARQRVGRPTRLAVSAAVVAGCSFAEESTRDSYASSSQTPSGI